MARTVTGKVRKTGVPAVDMALEELQREVAPKNRAVWTAVPDVKQLREGERHLYYDGTDIFMITRYGNTVYRTAALTAI